MYPSGYPFFYSVSNQLSPSLPSVWDSFDQCRNLSPTIRTKEHKEKEFLAAVHLIVWQLSATEQVSYLLSELSSCWVEGQLYREENRKSQFFTLCQNSRRLHWNLISTLEGRVVPSGHCTTRNFSCSRTALFFLSNPCDWPLLLPSDRTPHAPPWRYPEDVGQELCCISAFSPFVACPCLCLFL